MAALRDDVATLNDALRQAKAFTQNSHTSNKHENYQNKSFLSSLFALRHLNVSSIIVSHSFSSPSSPPIEPTHTHTHSHSLSYDWTCDGYICVGAVGCQGARRRAGVCGASGGARHGREGRGARRAVEQVLLEAQAAAQEIERLTSEAMRAKAQKAEVSHTHNQSINQSSLLFPSIFFLIFPRYFFPSHLSAFKKNVDKHLNT